MARKFTFKTSLDLSGSEIEPIHIFNIIEEFVAYGTRSKMFVLRV